MEGHSQQNVEGPQKVEDGIWVDLGSKKEKDISSKILEICTLKEYLEKH